MLDSFADKDISDFKAKYVELLNEYKKTKSEIEKSYGDPLERARRLDLLKYQNEEIFNANLKIGEDDELEARRTLIMNYEKIAKALNTAYSL